MRKSVLLVCAVLVLCFASGMVFAQHHSDKTAKSDLKATGKVVSTDDKDQTVTITIKKETKDVEMTFAVDAKTVFTPEGKTLADLAKDTHVVITYKAVEAGNATALTVKIVPVTKPKHDTKPN